MSTTEKEDRITKTDRTTVVCIEINWKSIQVGSKFKTQGQNQFARFKNLLTAYQVLKSLSLKIYKLTSAMKN